VEHRYGDESGPSWYSGSRYTDPPRQPADPEVSGSHARREDPYDAGGVRLPGQRPAGPEPRSPYESGRIPVRGPEYPTIPPPAPPARTEPQPRPVKAKRRPFASILVALAVLVLFLPVLRLLMTVTFASDATARGVVPAVLLALGLALIGFGLFAAAGGGAARANRDDWLRPPLAYLPVGLILLLAAGLAVA
jgi:hypothetical protein